MITDVFNLIRRGIFSLIDPITRKAQVQTGSKEAENEVPLMNPHGFVSIPTLGSNAVIIKMRNGSLCFSASDPSITPTGLVEGDVCVYDSRGQEIRLTATGIQINTTLPVSVTAPQVSVGEVATELLKASFADTLKTQMVNVTDSTGAPLTVTPAFLADYTADKTTKLKGE